VKLEISLGLMREREEKVTTSRDSGGIEIDRLLWVWPGA
jgi:hypothetical protein